MAYDLVNIYDHDLNEIPVDTFMNKYDLSKFLSIRGKPPMMQRRLFGKFNDT